MLNPKAALPTSHYPSFATARNDPPDYAPTSAWDASLNDESKHWACAVAFANEEVPGEVRQCPFKSRRNENDNVIVRDVKSSVEELTANEVVTIVKKALDEVSRKALHNADSSV